MVLSAEQQRLAKLLSTPENRYCADCHAPAPKWASFSLGYFVCIDCSGIHRMMGTHITKIKSTTLDSWQGQWVDLMANVGNVRFNAIYEAKLGDRKKKPGPNATMDERERFIRSKYERRAFYGAPSVATLRSACEDMEIKIESLPLGYMDGVDLTTVLSDAASGSQSPLPGGSVNPALARRHAKKAADEEAERSKRDAEEGRVRAAMEAEQAAAAATAAAAARAASEAERASAASNQASLADMFGGGGGASAYDGSPAPSSFGFLGAQPGASALQQQQFAPQFQQQQQQFPPQAFQQQQFSPQPQFLQQQQSFLPLASASPLFGAVAQAPQLQQQGGGSHFSFLSPPNGPGGGALGSDGSGSPFLPLPSPTTSTGGGSVGSGAAGGGIFGGLLPAQPQQPQVMQPGFFPSSVGAPPAPSGSPPFDPMSSLGFGAPAASPSSSSFSFLEAAAAPPQQAQAPPPFLAGASQRTNSGFGFLGTGTGGAGQAGDANLLSGGSPLSLPPAPVPTPAALAPSSSGGDLFSGMATSIPTPPLAPTPSPSLTAPVPSGVLKLTPGTYARLFEPGGPGAQLPTSMEALASRQSALAGIHAAAMADVMAEFAAKQAGVNAAYQSAVGRLSAAMAQLSSSGGGPAIAAAPFQRGGPSSSSSSGGSSNPLALEAALSTLEGLTPMGLAVGLDLRVTRIAAPVVEAALAPIAPAPAAGSMGDLFGGLSAGAPPSAPSAPAVGGFSFMGEAAVPSPSPPSFPSAGGAAPLFPPPSSGGSAAVAAVAPPTLRAVDAGSSGSSSSTGGGSGGLFGGMSTGASSATSLAPSAGTGGLFGGMMAFSSPQGEAAGSAPPTSGVSAFGGGGATALGPAAPLSTSSSSGFSSSSGGSGLFSGMMSSGPVELPAASAAAPAPAPALPWLQQQQQSPALPSAPPASESTAFSGGAFGGLEEGGSSGGMFGGMSLAPPSAPQALPPSSFSSPPPPEAAPPAPSFGFMAPQPQQQQQFQQQSAFGGPLSSGYYGAQSAPEAPLPSPTSASESADDIVSANARAAAALFA